MTATDQQMRASLTALRDVAGVTGSFVFTRSGRMVSSELPALLDEDAVAEASGRLARLRDCFSAVGDELNAAVIRYSDHKLYMKALPGGTLCILTDDAVNMPAMRMAANLVALRIGPALDAAAQD